MTRLLSAPWSTSGHFWLPESPKRRVAGELKYLTDRTEVLLHDEISDDRRVRRQHDEVRYAFVHGESSGGDALTVVDALSTFKFPTLGSAGGMRFQERLVSSVVLLHCHSDAETRYLAGKFRIPGLNTWLNVNPIKHEFALSDQTTNTFHVSNQIVKNFCVCDLDAELAMGLEAQVVMRVYSSVEARIHGAVELKPREPRVLDWYLEQLTTLTSFLTMAFGTSASPESICLTHRNPPESSWPKTIGVLVSLRDYRPCRFQTPSEHLVSGDNSRFDVGAALCNWCGLFQRFRLPISMAMTVLSGPDDAYQHSRFLSLMQALESLHRAKGDGLYMPPTDFEEVRRSLVGAIPDGVSSSHRDALEARIKFGNEYSLRTRLNELAESLPGEIRTALLGRSGAFPGKWVDTRNFYTHLDPGPANPILDGEELYHVNVRLEAFIRFLFLGMCGVPSDVLTSALDGPSLLARTVRRVEP